MNSFEYGFFDELEKIAESGLDKEAASAKQKAAAALLAGASLFGINRATKTTEVPTKDVAPGSKVSLMARHIPTHGSPRYPYYVGPDYYQAATTPSSAGGPIKKVTHGGDATPMPGRPTGASPDYSPHDLEMLKRDIIARPSNSYEK